MHTKCTTTGYSLVETLVAVSILLLSIVGPMTIASKGIQTGIFVGDQTTAIYLAQEQIESVMAIRNDEALLNDYEEEVWDWTTGGDFQTCFDGTGCNIIWRETTNADNRYYDVVNCTGANDDCRLTYNADGSRVKYRVGGAGEETMYTRVLDLTRVGDREVEAVVTVSWQANLFGTERSVVLRSSFFNIYDLSN